METAARELGVSPAELRRKNFVKSFPHQSAVIMCYDAGDFGASLDAAMKAIDYAGFAKRKAASGEKRQAARYRHEHLHRGLRHRTIGGSGFARRRCWTMEFGGSPGQCGRHHRGADGSHSHGQGHKRPSRSWSISVWVYRSTACPSCTATPTRCRWAWEHMARAPARSACRRSSRPSRRSRPRQEDRCPSARSR